MTTAPLAVEQAEHTIRPRQVRFDWAETPLHWIPGDPFATHLINVLHLLLPAGERWFVDVYRQALPLIDEDRLHGEVKGFMGQEAVHSRAHAAVLDHLRSQGIDPDPYTRRLEWMFEKLLGDHRLPSRLQPQWLVFRLAIIAAVEHYTAVLGNWILESRGLDEAGADDTMLDLLRWHGAEEVEHRSVAFDAYQHVSGTYVRRTAAMAVVAPTLQYLWYRGVRFLVRSDPSLRGVRFGWKDYRRCVREDKAPGAELVRCLPRYLRRRHHPSHEGSLAPALEYLGRSPAALAARSVPT